jgi:plastocyanin
MRLRPTLLVPVTLFVLGACGGGGDSSSNSPTSPTSPTGPSTPSTPSSPVATNQIEVGDDFFSPANVTVPVNTAVHWTWDASARTHNVTLSDGSGSGDQTGGYVFDKTFGTAGTFSYHCTIHPTMTGTVLVTQ